MKDFMGIVWTIIILAFFVGVIWFVIDTPDFSSNQPTSNPPNTEYLSNCADRCLQYNDPAECIDASGEVSSSVNCPFNRCMDTCS